MSTARWRNNKWVYDTSTYVIIALGWVAFAVAILSFTIGIFTHSPEFGTFGVVMAAAAIAMGITFYIKEG